MTNQDDDVQREEISLIQRLVRDALSARRTLAFKAGSLGVHFSSEIYRKCVVDPVAPKSSHPKITEELFRFVISGCELTPEQVTVLRFLAGLSHEDLPGRERFLCRLFRSTSSQLFRKLP